MLNGFSRGVARNVALATFVAAVAVALVASSRPEATAQVLDAPLPLPGGGVDDLELVLPDGRPLPALPVRVLGEWDRDDIRVYPWQADIAIRGDVFEGKITLPDFPIVLPLTVQGTREGDVVEFSVLTNDKEVSYFAGHLAGTSLVGMFEAPGGLSGEWSGSWFPDAVEIDGQAPR
jgi:hypothetical protein